MNRKALFLDTKAGEKRDIAGDFSFGRAPGEDPTLRIWFDQDKHVIFHMTPRETETLAMMALSIGGNEAAALVRHGCRRRNERITGGIERSFQFRAQRADPRTAAQCRCAGRGPYERRARAAGAGRDGSCKSGNTTADDEHIKGH